MDKPTGIYADGVLLEVIGILDNMNASCIDIRNQALDALAELKALSGNDPSGKVGPVSNSFFVPPTTTFH